MVVSWWLIVPQVLLVLQVLLVPPFPPNPTEWGPLAPHPPLSPSPHFHKPWNQFYERLLKFCYNDYKRGRLKIH
ncbi:MAG: hypothetical protein ACHBN1_36605 [Heteroscytonema crispum UTEX LB 1556]